MAGSAAKPSPPKIAGPQPKPEAGELLQIILRVPPYCPSPVAVGVVAVEVVAVVEVVVLGVVVVEVVVVLVVVVLVVVEVVLVVDEDDEVQATRDASTTTSRRQMNRVIFDLYIYTSYFASILRNRVIFL